MRRDMCFIYLKGTLFYKGSKVLKFMNELKIMRGDMVFYLIEKEYCFIKDKKLKLKNVLNVYLFRKKGMQCIVFLYLL